MKEKKTVTAEVLKGVDLFKGLDDRQLAKIVGLCHVYPMREGEQVFMEGTRATDLHICRSGKVNIIIWVREPWNKNVVVHQAEPGEVFGWSALVAPYTYTASAECVASGEQISASGHDLLAALDQHPDIGYIIMTNLSAEVSARLMQTRQRLSIEWLSSGWPTSSGTWGETGKR